MPMNQKTTSPVPVQPGRKVNPKMTTNRSMMMPTKDPGQPGNLKKKSKKIKGGKVKVNPPQKTDVSPSFIAPKAPAPSQKRGEKNTVTNESVQTQQVMQAIYGNLGNTIIKDSLIEEKDKLEVCKVFVTDLGLTQDILTFLNNNAEVSLTKTYQAITNGMGKLTDLHNNDRDAFSEEQRQAWEAQVSKEYAKVQKKTESFIDTLNSSFLSQESKYIKFKELVVLVNEHPIGDIASSVHRKFYIFTVSLIKAGYYKILMEDFYPQPE